VQQNTFAMNVPLAVGVLLLVVIGLAILIEVSRLQSTKRRRKRASVAPPRRSPYLEKRMVAAFVGPRNAYGDCFAEFSVWRQQDTTRMDLRTRGGWSVLDMFTRSLVLRYLWQTLAGLVKGAVTINVDLGTRHAMVWTAADTAQFNDNGVVAPWMPSKGRAGTLISGP
jgi:hypothetical protein